MTNKVKGLYVHVPFCHNICHYCDFNKYLYQSKWADEYLITLEKELLSADTYESIYIGGGSPSALSVDQLSKLLTMLEGHKAANCEYCIELNPEDMDGSKIDLLVKYGINRVSIGVQSFDKNILKLLNRKHCKEQVISLINQLRLHGINNLTCDLIFGIPNQDDRIIINDLDILVNELKVPHISTYALLVERHTYFAVHNIQALDDDIQANQYELIYNYLSKIGYNRYEVSNYSLPGYESKHNLLYWQAKEYKGVGPGASGYEQGIRYEISKSITDYCKGIINKEEHFIDRDEQMEEFVILALRLSEGLSFEEFRSRFNQDFLTIYHDTIQKLLTNNLVEIKDQHLMVRKEKVFILNQVLQEFIID